MIALSFREIIINEAKDIKVNRSGNEVTLEISEDESYRNLTNRKNKGKRFFGPRQYLFVVEDVPDDDEYPAKAAGIKRRRSDHYLSNGEPTPIFS